MSASLAKYGFDPIIIQPSLTPAEAELLKEVTELRAIIDEELYVYNTTNATKKIDKLIAVRVTLSKMIQCLTADSQRTEHCVLVLKGKTAKDLANAITVPSKRRRFEARLRRLFRQIRSSQ